ncbi:type II secretion system protein, partial [bacterium]|nr:type II secretion system protein [bacterium]
LPQGARGTRAAFTLAEVLITLGVIGVVAAMTLPMLAENYQRRVVETRLKKFYTTFNQAILRSVDVNGPYEWWSYNQGGTLNSKATREQLDNLFGYYLRPYMNIIQTQEIQFTDGSGVTLYYLGDGSAFHYRPKFPNDIYYYPKSPVRCLKQPAIDREGVCTFLFWFAPNMELSSATVYGYRKGLVPYIYNWNGTQENLYSGTYGCDSNKVGYYCSFLIQYNDWQFPPDYPRKIRY